MGNNIEETIWDKVEPTKLTIHPIVFTIFNVERYFKLVMFFLETVGEFCEYCLGMQG